jgi:IS5 family transposase
MKKEIDAEQGQLFATPFEKDLDLENRWVKFSKILPWNKLSGYYYSKMDRKMGAGTIDPRIVLGSLIIKHHEELSDDGTIENIKENIYMRYFLGLSSFKRDAVFSPNMQKQKEQQVKYLTKKANELKLQLVSYE